MEQFEKHMSPLNGLIIFSCFSHTALQQQQQHHQQQQHPQQQQFSHQHHQLQQQQQQQHNVDQIQAPLQGAKKRKKKNTNTTITNPEGAKTRRVIARRDWSGAEKAAVLHYFGDYVSRQKLPGKKEIEDCISKEEILCYRSWRNVKDFIRNTAQAQIKREAIFGPNTEFSLMS